MQGTSFCARPAVETGPAHCPTPSLSAEQKAALTRMAPNHGPGIKGQTRTTTCVPSAGNGPANTSRGSPAAVGAARPCPPVPGWEQTGPAHGRVSPEDDVPHTKTTQEANIIAGLVRADEQRTGYCSEDSGRARRRAGFRQRRDGWKDPVLLPSSAASSLQARWPPAVAPRGRAPHILHSLGAAGVLGKFAGHQEEHRGMRA